MRVCVVVYLFVFTQTGSSIALSCEAAGAFADPSILNSFAGPSSMEPIVATPTASGDETDPGKGKGKKGKGKGKGEGEGRAKKAEE